VRRQETGDRRQETGDRRQKITIISIKSKIMSNLSDFFRYFDLIAALKLTFAGGLKIKNNKFAILVVLTTGIEKA